MEDRHFEDGPETYEMSIDDPKGDDSILPIDIWDMREWLVQDEGIGEALNLIQEIILRWRKRNLMRDFCWEIKRSLSVWRSVGTSRGVKSRR